MPCQVFVQLSGNYRWVRNFVGFSFFISLVLLLILFFTGVHAFHQLEGVRAAAACVIVSAAHLDHRVPHKRHVTPKYWRIARYTYIVRRAHAVCRQAFRDKSWARPTLHKGRRANWLKVAPISDVMFGASSVTTLAGASCVL